MDFPYRFCRNAWLPFTRGAEERTICKAMVRPLLEYGKAIWGPLGDIKIVESVQHKATKIINHLRDNSYEEILKELKLPSLTYRRHCGDMVQVYKIVNGVIRIDGTKSGPQRVA